jgi:hypothetical protein
LNDGARMRTPLLFVVLGCSSPDHGVTTSHSTKSDDPEERAAAADDILGSPDTLADKLAALELLLQDREPRVREQAVLTYGMLAERDGVRLLKEIALTDPSAEVVAAALASLDRIATEFPEPPRGWLQVVYPDTFATGSPFTIHVRFGSSAEAERAEIVVQLPPWIEMADPKQPPIWKGGLEAGRNEEQKFDVVATKDGRGGSRVHLTLDYPDPLDIEKFHDRMRVAVDGGHGHFEPLPVEIEQ